MPCAKVLVLTVSMPWGDASRASYNADPNKAKAAARKESNKNPDPKRQPLIINIEFNQIKSDALKQYSANPEPKKSRS